MNTKKVLGIIALILGVIFVAISIYIKGQVEAGKVKVAHAEKQIEQGKHLFPLNPVTKSIEKEVTKEADTRIEASKEKIARFEGIARVLQIVGIILIVLGGILFFLPRKK
jgi:hypothetical protein